MSLTHQWYAIQDQGLLDATILAWIQDHQNLATIEGMMAYLEANYGQTGAILPLSFSTMYAHGFAAGEFSRLARNSQAQLLAGAIFAGVGIGGANLGGLKREMAGSTRALVPYYPPNDGFAGKPVKITLEPGTIIDRYGSPNGEICFAPGDTKRSASVAAGHGNGTP